MYNKIFKNTLQTQIDLKKCLYTKKIKNTDWCLKILLWLQGISTLFKNKRLPKNKTSIRYGLANYLSDLFCFTTSTCLLEFKLWGIFEDISTTNTEPERSFIKDVAWLAIHLTFSVVIKTHFMFWLKNWYNRPEGLVHKHWWSQ